MRVSDVTRPNVLLICADHWFGDLVGALGHPVILTPTLDHIIGNGIAYTNAYAPTPYVHPRPSGAYDRHALPHARRPRFQ